MQVGDLAADVLSPNKARQRQRRECDQGRAEQIIFHFIPPDAALARDRNVFEGNEVWNLDGNLLHVIGDRRILHPKRDG